MKCPCEHCGTNLDFDPGYLGMETTCPSCGKDTTLFDPAFAANPPPPPQQPPPVQPGGETIFLKDNTALVTNTRFVVGSRIFPVNAIASVEASRVPPKTFWATMATLFTAICLVGTMPNIKRDPMPFVIVLALFAASLAWFINKSRTNYQVVIFNSGGQVTALTSRDRDYINLVTHALNDAIIHRG